MGYYLVKNIDCLTNEIVKGLCGRILTAETPIYAVNKSPIPGKELGFGQLPCETVGWKTSQPT